MKKINILRYSALAVIAAIAFIACSKDTDSALTNAQSLTVAQQSLKDQFANIVKSDEFILKESKTKELVTKFKGLSADMSSRSNFSIWLDSHIQGTLFTSKNDALKLYDEALTATDVEMTLNQKFYDQLIPLDNTTIRDILQPSLGTPPQAITNSNPCQNGCMDTVIANMDFADETHTNFQHGHHTVIKKLEENTQYWETMSWIVANFNDCMGHC